MHIYVSLYLLHTYPQDKDTNAVVFTVSASDPDSGKNKQIGYNITAVSDSATLCIEIFQCHCMVVLTPCLSQCFFASSPG